MKNLTNKPLGMKAGLSALAHYSNLAEPANPVLAIAGKQLIKVRATDGAMTLDVAESNASEIEVWSYSPGLFANKGLADRFSLFLSMREDNDERVQSALKA